MSRLIKILHLDPNYQITWFFSLSIGHPDLVPPQTAIDLLKTGDFDLIVSESHNKAILKEQPYLKGQ